MDILVLNAGSSSVKFQLIETSPGQIAAHSDRALAKGSVEKIGTGEAVVSLAPAGGPETKAAFEILEHRRAVEIVLQMLAESGGEMAVHAARIAGVGHRIVHGGERFSRSVLIDAAAVEAIEAAIDLAPLHNPHNLKGYRAAREALPDARHVAVFDTAFHATLPLRAWLYGLPRALYERHGVRRYGFHGTSHRWVAAEYARHRGGAPEDFKLITCHLGNGCSVCAVDRGRSIDTSMGFTPLEGLVMGTRSGDVDPAAILHVMAKEELGLHEVNSLLNKHSGLYGISGLSNDMRRLLEYARDGERRAEEAIDVFCYRVKKYIGAYFAALDGADAVVFTGGIGENAPEIRKRICAGLAALGVRVDPERNANTAGSAGMISADDSATEVWAIPTNEELLIARDTLQTIRAADGKPA